MTMAPGFLDRRLLFVVGKGGVGKTTLGAALGLAALERGKRVLIVELEQEDGVCPLLGLVSARGPEPSEILPGLFRMSVGGRAALEEYLSLIIPIRRVLRAIFDSKVYQYFVAVAPGLRELMTVGKIWYEVDQGRWDLVIVDCPATGHSLQYLRMPKAAYETFTTGLVHREAKRVWDLLRDPARTAVVVATIAEEMPVNETLEICRQLDGELELPRGVLFVNRYHAMTISRADLESARRAKPVEPVSAVETAFVEAVLARGEEEASWADLNEGYRRRLEEESGWPLVLLPFLFREEFGMGDVETLAGEVATALAPAGSASRRRTRS